MKSAFVINGLGGERKLKGSVKIGGAKNAALKILPASILFGDTLHVSNVPFAEDIRRTTELMEDLGISILHKGNHEYEISHFAGGKTELSHDIGSKIRASIVFTGPMLSRFGKVSFSMPGGCLIGKRPIDFFLDGFSRMGVSVNTVDLGNTLRFSLTGKPKGAEFFLKTPSVTATETFMLAGVLASGTTVIKNAAMEPEILSIANFLNQCGASISGVGTSTVVIRGGKLLESAGRVYDTLPDRIEAGSYAILAALAAKDVTVENCIPAHMESLLAFMESSGVKFAVKENSLRFVGSSKSRYTSFHVKTQGYPGFATDFQAMITLFLTQTYGVGSVFETLYESRLEYVHDLQQMGANIHGGSNEVIVTGPTPLHGKEMTSLDIRSGMAFILAGIIAHGRSVIHNTYNVDRGYEDIEGKLRGLGVDISRLEEC